MQKAGKQAHPLALSGSLLAKVLDHLYDAATLCAFALASSTLCRAATRRIYSDITVPDAGVNGNRESASTRRRLLTRTLENSPYLGGLVRRLSTCIVPTAEIGRLLSACPQIRSLRWQIINVPLDQLGTSWYINNSLPSVPANVNSFDLHQQVKSRFWPGSLERALTAASQISSLSLYAPIETVETLLVLCGRNLRKLNLCIWNANRSLPSEHQLRDCFLKIPQIERLHLYATRPNQLHLLNMLPNLRRLSFECVTYDVVNQIIQEIAQGSEWCPNLTMLPRFTNIARTSFLFTKRGRPQWRHFKNKCRLAKMNISQRSAWKGSAIEIDHLLRRVQA